MFEISWSKLNSGSVSKEINFESFCYQVAYRKYKNYGEFEYLYNTPGSEFYLTLYKDCEELHAQKGDVIGWQAKFWLNENDQENSKLDAKHREELEKGFKKSLEYKDKLVHWIICTPGKFSNTRPYTPWDKLRTNLQEIKGGTYISHWHRDAFEAFFHASPETFISIFNLYFNAQFIIADVPRKITEKHLNQLEKKFDVELHVKDSEEIDLMNSILPERAKLAIEQSILEIEHIFEEAEKYDRIDQYDRERIDKELADSLIGFYNFHKSIVKAIKDDLSRNEDVFSMAFKTLERFDQWNEIRKPLTKKLNKLLKEKADGYHDFWIREILDAIKKVTDLISRDESQISLKTQLKKISAKEIHVFGGAGYGKTHLACSFAYEVLKQEKPVFLFLGSSFKSNIRPHDRILELLEISDMQFCEFLGVIDTLGAIHKCKVPIIIDGLNESYPSAGQIWNGELESMVSDIQKYENILLLTTCREKEEYIQQIFDVTTYDEIENNFRLEGFTEQNREEAIEKYFKKYDIKPSSKSYDSSLFEHPLRLKIFCEVNRNRENFDIDINAVVSSIDEYTHQLLKKVSVENYAPNRKILFNLKKGLLNLGEKLWNTNSRTLNLWEEFEPIFGESITEKLIDEGLCFQRDLNQTDELIQFTYDLVGGVQIAEAIFFSDDSEEAIIEKLQSESTQKKLFSSEKNERHPLHEDILIAISYLLPLKIGKQLFEILPFESVLIENIQNIELFTAKNEDKQKLIAFIYNSALKYDSKRRLLKQIYEEVVLRNNFSTFDLILPITQGLSQFELDTIWNELVRKDLFKLLRKLNHFTEISFHKDDLENVLLFILFLTGNPDRLLRGKATERITLMGTKYPDELLSIARRCYGLTDLFIVESLVCSLTGVTFRLQDKDYTQRVVDFFESNFLKKTNTNHVAILDYINTVFNFGEANFGLKTDYSAIKRNINESWNYEAKEVKKLESREYFLSYQMMDYDFIKYQISALSNNYPEDEIDKFSDAEKMAFIVSRVQRWGYGDHYKKLEASVSEDSKYSREDEAIRLESYSQKYLWISYLEFAGYLILNSYLQPEYEDSLRFSYITFDPSFTQQGKKVQIFTNSILPSNNELLQDWVLKDSSQFLKNFYECKPPFEEEEMVLLWGRIEQKANNILVKQYVDSFLYSNGFDESYLHKENISLEIDYSNIFAGEIPWHFPKGQIQDIYPLASYYSWKSWAGNRFRSPNFVFLNPILANKFDLKFSVNSLSYLDKNGVEITKYFSSSNSEFLFIRKDFLNGILSEHNFRFAWHSNLEKFGELRYMENSKLKTPYKRYNSFDKYFAV